MDEAKVNRLCEELGDLIELAAGFNPDALGRARWAIMTFKALESGDHIDKNLDALASGFEEWFSIDKWNRKNDGGRLVKQSLDNELICIRAAMWRTARGIGRD